MRRSKRLFSLGLAVVVAACLALPLQASATDDFGRVVQHIEVNYRVHRQHRFAMGMAGFVVKFWHFAGVKNFKGAIFENQRFMNAASDTRFDEIVRAAMDSGWQPMVQEWDRRSGERVYIYGQVAGKDLKVFAVVLESSEAVVFQVKLNPNKFEEFVREAGLGRHRRERITPREETQPPGEEKIEVAAASEPRWDGICLLQQEPDSPGQP